ncbi:addiction module toxin RelE [Pseudomonas endophytica]|mgnify:CR=1 FL=1|uniref:Addiction module toxin RelE n=1 Tax=Pseudomonas endophytica TaxID=1563157 RepID=A0A0Q0SZ51_9PSED|nr:type II toxin-antitoxin system RelE/ParE family toxin [Pseudomonas endophytica]KQB52039.1 addiction module toxin RelE [Pseudomonas endophytica]
MSSSLLPKNPKRQNDLIKIYTLEFVIEAKKELSKLDKVLQVQLLKKLKSRLLSPRVPAAKLSNMHDCYKIKLRASSLRRVYEVIDDRLVVLVLGVGKRDDNAAYVAAKKRLH